MLIEECRQPRTKYVSRAVATAKLIAVDCDRCRNKNKVIFDIAMPKIQMRCQVQEHVLGISSTLSHYTIINAILDEHSSVYSILADYFGVTQEQK
jgi:hypothetical protein